MAPRERGCNQALCYGKCWSKLLLTKQTFDLFFSSILWHIVWVLIYVHIWEGWSFKIRWNARRHFRLFSIRFQIRSVFFFFLLIVVLIQSIVIFKKKGGYILKKSSDWWISGLTPRAKKFVFLAICWPNFYSLANINPKKPHKVCGCLIFASVSVQMQRYPLEDF
jgi:hypothetical protein